MEEKTDRVGLKPCREAARNKHDTNTAKQSRLRSDRAQNISFCCLIHFLTVIKSSAIISLILCGLQCKVLGENDGHRRIKEKWFPCDSVEFLAKIGAGWRECERATRSRSFGRGFQS